MVLRNLEDCVYDCLALGNGMQKLVSDCVSPLASPSMLLHRTL